jgi:hypothetical protein
MAGYLQYIQVPTGKMYCRSDYYESTTTALDVSHSWFALVLRHGII